MADNGRLTVDRKVKVVLFYAETKSVVATQRRFRTHFGTRWAPCKQTIYRLSLGTIFQPMRINSVQMSNAFVTIKMCYVYNQWYDISCATLYIPCITHNYQYIKMNIGHIHGSVINEANPASKHHTEPVHRTTLWSRGHHRFIFWRSQVIISSWSPLIPTENFHDFP